MQRMNQFGGNRTQTSASNLSIYQATDRHTKQAHLSLAFPAWLEAPSPPPAPPDDDGGGCELEGPDLRFGVVLREAAGSFYGKNEGRFYL